MASPFKSVKKRLRRGSARILGRAIQSPDGTAMRRLAPFLSSVDMLVNDYGVVRLIYGNEHQVADNVWRGAQPSPGQIARLARRGVKTIINLRNDQTLGTRWLEEQACARNNIVLVDLTLKSRAAPSREDFLKIRELISHISFPVFLHCKSGSDRAGLMSVMVKHLHDGAPISEARRQLSLRYGHIRQAETGILGYVFEQYLAFAKDNPITFYDWVEAHYDPDAITRSYRSSGWANRIVNGLLKRE